MTTMNIFRYSSLLLYIKTKTIGTYESSFVILRNRKLVSVLGLTLGSMVAVEYITKLHS